jgi:hypothetical protein
MPPKKLTAKQTRRKVWDGKLKKTSGGLEIHQLKLNSGGRIVSVKASNKAKDLQNLGLKRLTRPKGKFVAVRS